MASFSPADASKMRRPRARASSNSQCLAISLALRAMQRFDAVSGRSHSQRGLGHRVADAAAAAATAAKQASTYQVDVGGDSHLLNKHIAEAAGRRSRRRRRIIHYHVCTFDMRSDKSPSAELETRPSSAQTIADVFDRP